MLYSTKMAMSSRLNLWDTMRSTPISHLNLTVRIRSHLEAWQELEPRCSLPNCSLVSLNRQIASFGCQYGSRLCSPSRLSSTAPKGSFSGSTEGEAPMITKLQPDEIHWSLPRRFTCLFS